MAGIDVMALVAAGPKVDRRKFNRGTRKYFTYADRVTAKRRQMKISARLIQLRERAAAAKEWAALQQPEVATVKSEAQPTVHRTHSPVSRGEFGLADGVEWPTMSEDVRYCMVPDCDERPYPGNDLCDTHLDEIEAQRRAGDRCVAPWAPYQLHTWHDGQCVHCRKQRDV